MIAGTLDMVRKSAVMVCSAAVSVIAVVLMAFMAARALDVADASGSDGAPTSPADSSGHDGMEAALSAGTVAVGSFEFRPHVLNLRSSGEYVTGLLILPEGRNVRDVYIPSIMLNGVVYASTSFGPHNLVVEYLNKQSVMLKFDRGWVQEVLSPGTAVPVWLTGVYTDGTGFSATGVVTVTA
jgi:hypothetical protein